MDPNVTPFSHFNTCVLVHAILSGIFTILAHIMITMQPFFLCVGVLYDQHKTRLIKFYGVQKCDF